MPTYVFDRARGEMVDKATGQPMLSPEERARPLPVPRVFGDYEGFVSPASGEWIEGRKARRNDMEKHNCVDGNDLPGLGGKLKNERFAKKWGMEARLEK